MSIKLKNLQQPVLAMLSIGAAIVAIFYYYQTLNIVKNFHGTSTGTIDLNDPSTILGIRNALVNGMDPGNLVIDSTGHLAVTPKSDQGIQGEDGEPGQQGERGLQGLSGLNGTSDGWKKQNGVVSLADASDLVGLGTDNPHFKLQVNGDVGPGTDDQNSLGSETARWQSVNVGTGGVKLVNSYIDANNNETGGLGYAQYTVPLPGASTVLSFENETNFTQQELKNGATSYTASGSDITTNAPISANAQIGCRIQLNDTWYTITQVADPSHFSLETSPASSGVVNHLYCTVIANNKLQLSSHTVVGPGDLNTFNMATPDPDATTVTDTWSKPIIYSINASKYVTAGYIWDNTNRVYHAVIYSSSDLQTWSKQVLDTSTSDTQIKNMIYESGSGRIIAAGYDNTSGTDSFVVWESTDGDTWTKHIVNANGSYWDGPQMIVYDTNNHRYVYGALYYNGSQYTLDAWESSDLINWTVHNVQSFSSYPNVTALIYAPTTGKFVFGGSYSTGGSRGAAIWESSDLVTWNRVQVDPSGSRFTAMAFDADHGKYLGMGWSNAGCNTLWESTDLNTWTSHTIQQSSCSPSSIMYNPDSQKYIIGGENRDPNSSWRGGLWFSSDLTNWTTVYVTPTNIDGKVLGLNYDPVNGRFISAGMVWGNRYDQATVWYTEPGTIFNYPSNKPYVVTTSDITELNSSNWLTINAITSSQQLNNQQIYVALSYDRRNTWKILQTGENSWRSIVQNSNGIWQFNASQIYNIDLWQNSSENTVESALSQAMLLSSNQMTAIELEAFHESDYGKPNGFVAKNQSLDIASGLLTTQGVRTPRLSNFLVNYGDSYSNDAVTISSKATGTGEVKPFQVQVGMYDKALFINSDGNVGIGTNTPEYLLSVSGNAGIEGNLLVNGNHTVSGITTVNAVTANGNAVFNSTLTANANATVNGVLNPTDMLTIGGSVLAKNNVTVQSGNLFVGKYNGKFGNKTVLNTSTQASNVAVGDTDGDGHNDIVIVDNNASTLSLYHNNGDGTFSNPVAYNTVAFPSDTVVIDINNDTYADVVTTSPGSSSISVLLGNHDGTLTEHVDYAAGSFPNSLVASDFNADGYIDIATACFYGNSVAILLNNGNGTYASKIEYQAGNQPIRIAAGDLNGDNYPDIVVTNGNASTFSVLLNNQEGAFAKQSEIIAMAPLTDIEIGDFNGDHLNDVVLSSSNYSQISIFYNTGVEISSTSTDISTLPTESLALNDVNKDGLMDILLDNMGYGEITLLRNTGNGIFTQTSYNIGTFPYSTVLADINGDDYADVVSLNYTLGTVSILNNAPDVLLSTNALLDSVGIGTTTPSYKLDVQGGQINASDGLCINAQCITAWSQTGAYSYATIKGGLTNFATGISVANNDAALTASGNLTNIGSYQGGEMLLSRGGTLGTRTDYYAGSYPTDVAVADVNGDSKPDLVIPSDYSNYVSVLMNNGNGTFAPKIDYVTESAPWGIVLADVTNDGLNDMVITNSGNNRSISVFPNNGNGTFGTRVNYPANDTVRAIASGDVDGDGLVDIIAASASGNLVSVYRNNGDGTLASKADYDCGNNPYDVVVNDVNSDGKPDIAVANYGTTMVTVLINEGRGTFNHKATYSTGRYPQSLTEGDVNGDLKPDLVVANIDSGNFSVLLNDGNGGFSARTDYLQFYIPGGVSLGDLNGDGKADLVVGGYSYTGMSVYMNSGTGTFPSRTDYVPLGNYVANIVIKDLNGDGKNDVVYLAAGGYVSVYLNQTSPLFYAQASTGRVGIGTTTPGYKLDVQGGQINASGGLCIAGVCWTNLPTMPYSPFSMKNGVLDFSAGLSVMGGATITSNGNIKNVGTYSGGEMVLKSSVLSYASNITLGYEVFAIALGDVTGDSVSDMVTASPSGYIAFYKGIGNGTYEAKVNYPSGAWTTDVAIGDVNGDGLNDMVAKNKDSGTISIFRSLGNGSFASKVDYSVSGYSVLIVDVNGDGRNDIVVGGNGIEVMINNGAGGFNAPINYAASGFESDISTGDFNSDGYIDIAFVSYGGSGGTIFYNSGRGTFENSSVFGNVGNPKSVVVRDLNGDGRSDIAVSDINWSCGSSLNVFINSGNGAFSQTNYQTGGCSYSLTISDFNNDGFPDLVYTADNVGTQVRYNNGNGVFGAATPIGGGGRVVASGDINADGKPDLLMLSAINSPSLMVYLSQTSPMFYAQASTGFVGIGTVTPAVNLDVAGAFRIAGNMTVNNTSMATGTLATAPATGTCTGQTNSTTQAVFQNSAALTNVHIFYNSTRTKHSRVTSVAACTDGSSNQYRILTLTDAITGSTTGDSYTVYNPLSDIGNASSGFFNNIYAINFKGLTSTLSGGFDIAEQYQTNDGTITFGDVVSISQGDGKTYVQHALIEKAKAESDSRVIGVVSTNPGLTLGAEKEGDWVSVALSGHVPVKVSAMNGSITSGDFLTSSTIPGVAVKALQPGMVIGRAMGDFACPEDEPVCQGTVDMFINPIWYVPPQYLSGNIPTTTPVVTPTPIAQDSTQQKLLAGYAVIKTNDSTVQVMYSQQFEKTPVLTVSAQKMNIQYEIIDATNTGFTIKLQTPVTEDITFSWIAVQVSQPQTVESTIP